MRCWVAMGGMLLLAAATLSGFDPATHMYLGTQPEVISFWESFGDSSFAADLDMMLVRKFYLIGLTLPDLLDYSSQCKARDLLNELYDVRDHATGPLKISSTTHDNVQTPIAFPGASPNRNLEKLRQMALYARDAGWASQGKR